MRSPVSLLALGLVAAVLVAPALAAVPDDMDAVRAHYAALRTLRRSVAEQSEAGREIRALLSDAEESFRASFATVDFGAWDVAEERDLVVSGLSLVARDALSAGRADDAVRAYEYFLLALPGDARAESVRASGLPRALLAAGDPAAAVARLTQLAARVGAPRRSEVSRYLAAAHAAGGDFEASRVACARAADEVEHVGIPDRQIKQEFGITARALERVRRERIEHCAARIGGEPPALSPRAAAGGSASSVRQKPGRVLVLNVFPFTDAGSRDLLRDLDALARRGPRERVQVVSVTCCDAPELEGMSRSGAEIARKYAPKLLMPADPDDPGGEPIAVGRENLVKLLRLFHKRMDLRHPLVLMDPDGFGEWFGELRHLVIVVDAERRVRHVGFHGDGAVVRGIVDAVLSPLASSEQD